MRWPLQTSFCTKCQWSWYPESSCGRKPLCGQMLSCRFQVQHSIHVSVFVCMMWLVWMTRTTLYLAMVWGLLDQQFHIWFFFWRASCRVSQMFASTRTSSHFLSTSLWRYWNVVASVHESWAHRWISGKLVSGYYDIHSTMINPSKHCGLPVNRERRYTVMTLRNRVRTFVRFFLDVFFKFSSWLR